MKISVSSVTFVLFMTFAFGCARGNELRQLGLEERVRVSDVIAVGRAEGARPEFGRPGEQFRSINFVIDRVVKGAPPGEIELIVSGAIPELDPACCIEGKTYLLFAQEGRKGRYFVTNGVFGSFEVSNGAVVGWPSHEERSSKSLVDVLAELETK